ncbi:hypothetical protein BVRB_4g091990 [Beta vulgaris subsp. vulgaris]|nr:hypothetical protein BVRB_4g091990 [Beta vulgaris subsp. vulgaris]
MLWQFHLKAVGLIKLMSKGEAYPKWIRLIASLHI